MSLKSRRGRLKRNRENEDVNPMASVANMADAMLVLAVGIMVALVGAWQLNLSDVQNNARVEIADDEESLDASDEDVGELERYGSVYMDENGNYYIIQGDDEIYLNELNGK